MSIKSSIVVIAFDFNSGGPGSIPELANTSTLFFSPSPKETVERSHGETLYVLKPK
jgi:hypothetical protein